MCWQPKQEDIDWLRTVTDLCQFSELAPRREPEQGFYLDGYYFGLMVFKTMPRATWPKTFEPFFALTIPNLRVVVNMQPLPVESEMRYEEERFAKLVSNIDPQSPSLQSEVGLDKHRERMRRLMSNQGEVNMPMAPALVTHHPAHPFAVLIQARTFRLQGRGLRIDVTNQLGRTAPPRSASRSQPARAAC